MGFFDGDSRAFFACASTVSFMRGISCFKSRSLSQTNLLHVILFNLLTVAELFLGFNTISLRFFRVFCDLPSTLVKFGHVASPPVEIFLFFVLPPVEIFLCTKTQFSQVNHPTTYEFICYIFFLDNLMNFSIFFFVNFYQFLHWFFRWRFGGVLPGASIIFTCQEIPAINHVFFW